jgi:molybdopterin-guanine dinucleotide biosynthesis protein A
MRILGAIIAGGQSRRFGSDKALALYKGRPLFDHAASMLRPHVAALVAVGRDWPGLVRVDDHPRAGMGPLGGLCGALRYAEAKGFDAVLTSSCDVLGLSDAAIAALRPGPAIVDSHPVIGLWPAALAGRLADWLAATQRHAVFGFAEHVGARRVELAAPLRNINSPDDLRECDAD